MLSFFAFAGQTVAGKVRAAKHQHVCLCRHHHMNVAGMFPHSDRGFGLWQRLFDDACAPSRST
jgi:hypothetical protein